MIIGFGFAQNVGGRKSVLTVGIFWQMNLKWWKEMIIWK